MTSRIEEIYQKYVNSREFEEKATKADVELTWLEDKLCHEDMQKLEESITIYHANNGKAFFESGFRFAWELIMECSGKGESDSCRKI